MKKKQPIIVFLLTGLILGLGIQSSLVLAEEKNVTSNELTEPQEKDTFTEIKAIEDKKEKSSGTYGTVPWNWEAQTQTIVFGEGEFPNENYITTIVDNIENSTILEGKKIKHITFTKPVIASTDSRFLFYNLSELESIENLNFLTVSSVTNMAGMFASTSNLKTLDVSGWDTRNVTDMSSMFIYTTSMTKLDLNKWDTSQVKSMHSMFRGAKHLTTLDVSNWNTSNVTDMSLMFYDTSSLSTLDVGNWNTSNVTDMSYMFFYASSLTTLDVGNWNTSNVTDMSLMFCDTSSLSILDVSTWDVSSVNNMSHMFRQVNSLTTLDVSNWNTSNVTDMSYMFFYASNLSTLDVSSWNTANVTNMSDLFDGAHNLLALDVSNWNTNQVTNMSGIFRETKSLTTLDISNWNTSNVTDMSGLFAHTGNLTALDVSNWDTSNVTDMATMFTSASSLKALDVSRWNTDNVKNMSDMFSQTSKLEFLDVSQWNTSNVKNMRSVFESASSLTTLDVSRWNTSNVKNMRSVFDCASSLTTLDVSRWNTSNVTDMTLTFAYTSNLKSIDVSNWDTNNVKDMINMFLASGLTYLDISKWKTSNVDGMFLSSNSLDTIVLGEHNLINNSDLPEKKDELYTGSWMLASTDIQNRYSNSQELMSNYDGTKPGKYVREKYQNNTKVTGIELSPGSLELNVSDEVTLQTKIKPLNANNKNISYTTSDNTIVTVSTEGIIKGIKKGTAVITAITEDGGFEATSAVTVLGQNSLLIDPFILGIDNEITGSLELSSPAKKVQLVINDKVVTTSTIYRDGSFELDTKGMITKNTDKVEVIALDRKNKEIERATVTIEEKSYALSVAPYTLYEDTTITGQTDYFHTHVALLINGEEIERTLLSSTRKFSFDVEGFVDYLDDEVEIVGYRYEEEITRKKVVIQEPVIEMALTPYKVDEPYITGKVTGKTVATVRLYVNRRRQQTVKITEDGTFNLLGVAILSPTDKVEIAVLNEEGIELQRFSVTVTN